MTPDLVILDSRLPDMAGIDVLKALRAEAATRDLPVIVTHEAADAGTRQAALSCGADDVMAKPVDEVQLLARMRALLRARDRAEDMRLRNATLGALGLAEAAIPFDRPALVGYVTDRPEAAQDRRKALLAAVNERVAILSRDGALWDPGTAPDAYVIEVGTDEDAAGADLGSPKPRGKPACRDLPCPAGRAERGGGDGARSGGQRCGDQRHGPARARASASAASAPQARGRPVARYRL